MENQILSGGISNFQPIVEKLGDIATEFIPIITQIAVAILGITVIFGVVKSTISYLNGESLDTFGGQINERIQQRKERKTRRRKKK